jgi:hypothetical protein
MINYTGGYISIHGFDATNKVLPKIYDLETLQHKFPAPRGLIHIISQWKFNLHKLHFVCPLGINKSINKLSFMIISIYLCLDLGKKHIMYLCAVEDGEILLAHHYPATYVSLYPTSINKVCFLCGYRTFIQHIYVLLWSSVGCSQWY